METQLNSDSKLIKVLAFFISFYFTLFSTFSYAKAIPVAQVGSYGDNPLSISIPSELGILRNSTPIFQKKGIIFHIQDAHGQLEAQENIEKLLHYLNSEHNVNLIFMEGALQGSVSKDLLRFYSEPKANENVVEQLLEKGLIGGAEKFLVNSDKETKGFGVENSSLYRENLELFRDVYKYRKITDIFLSQFRSRIDLLSTHYFNSDLRKFVMEWLKFSRKENLQYRFIQFLNKSSKKYLNLDLNNPRTQLRYPQLTRFFTLKKLEEELKGEDAQKDLKVEKVKFNNWLTNKDISSETQNLFKLLLDFHSLSSVSNIKFDIRKTLEIFYTQASKKGFQFQDYPQLTRVIGSLMLSQELQATQLFLEVEGVSEAILGKLTQSEIEKDLVGLIKKYLSLKKLFALELTREDWRKINLYGIHLIAPEELVSSIHGTVESKRIEELKVDFEIKEAFEKATQFYAVAEKRESVIVESVLINTKENQNAVLVTGGFHSGGLRDLVEKGRKTFIEITPKVTHLNSDHTYLNQMLLSDVSTVPSLSLGKLSLPQIDRNFGSESGRYVLSQLMPILSRTDGRSGIAFDVHGIKPTHRLEQPQLQTVSVAASLGNNYLENAFFKSARFVSRILPTTWKEDIKSVIFRRLAKNLKKAIVEFAIQYEDLHPGAQIDKPTKEMQEAFLKIARPLVEKWSSKLKNKLRYRFLLPLVLNYPEGDEEYRRNSIFIDKDTGFGIFTHVWKKDGKTLIHNHDGTMALLMPFTNEMKEEVYQLVEKPKSPEWDKQIHDLEMIEERKLGLGTVASFTRGQRSIHRVKNSSPSREGLVMEIYVWMESNPPKQVNVPIPVWGEEKAHFILREEAGKLAVPLHQTLKPHSGQLIRPEMVGVFVDHLKLQMEEYAQKGKVYPIFIFDGKQIYVFEDVEKAFEWYYELDPANRPDVYIKLTEEQEYAFLDASNVNFHQESLGSSLGLSVTEEVQEKAELFRTLKGVGDVEFIDAFIQNVYYSLLDSPPSEIVVDPENYQEGPSLFVDYREKWLKHFEGYFDIATLLQDATPEFIDYMKAILLKMFFERFPEVDNLPVRAIEELVYEFIRLITGMPEVMSFFKMRALRVGVHELPLLHLNSSATSNAREMGHYLMGFAAQANIATSDDFRAAGIDMYETEQRMKRNTTFDEDQKQDLIEEPFAKYAMRIREVQPKFSIDARNPLLNRLLERNEEDEIKSKQILYFLDNTMESIFDLGLIRWMIQMGHQVTLVAKEKEADNDMTVDDVNLLLSLEQVKDFFKDIDIQEKIKVISSGSATRGTNLRRATPVLVEAWQQAEIIISKGEGNRGTLQGVNKDVYHFVMAKQGHETPGIHQGTIAVEHVLAAKKTEASSLGVENVDDSMQEFILRYLEPKLPSPQIVAKPKQYRMTSNVFSSTHPEIKEKRIANTFLYLEMMMQGLSAETQEKNRLLLKRFMDRPELEGVNLRLFSLIVYDFIKILTERKEGLSNAKKEAYSIVLDILHISKHEFEGLESAREQGALAIDFATRGNQTTYRTFLEISQGSIPTIGYRAHMMALTNEPLAWSVDDRSELLDLLLESEKGKVKSKHVLYLLDNVIEDVFDLILVQWLLEQGHTVTLVVKELEAGNDTTFEDINYLIQQEKVLEYLKQSGNVFNINIVSSKSATHATDLRFVTEEDNLGLYHSWLAADVIIAKGEGNRGALQGIHKDFFSLVNSKAGYETPGIKKGTRAVERNLGYQSRTALRSTVFQHINGIVLAPVMNSLAKRGVFNLFRPSEGGYEEVSEMGETRAETMDEDEALDDAGLSRVLTLKQIAESRFANRAIVEGNPEDNMGNLYGALRMLALQGWLTMEGVDEETKFALTEQGWKAVGLAEKGTYIPSVEAVSNLNQLYRLIRGPPAGLGMLFRQKSENDEQLKSYKKLIQLSKKNWGIRGAKYSIEERVYQQVVKQMDGMLLGPTFVALAMPLYEERGEKIEKTGPSFFEHFDPETHTLDLTTLKGSFHPEFLNEALGLLENKGFIVFEGTDKKVVRLTATGRVMGTRPRKGKSELATAYGVTNSYLVGYQYVDEWLFGNGAILDSIEGDRLDRVMDVWGSGGSHKAYLGGVLSYMEEVFNKPLEDQPEGYADMGSGSGEMAEEITDFILNKTARGNVLEEKALTVVTSDYDRASQRRSRATMETAFGNRKDIHLETLYGDITKPGEYDAAIRNSSDLNGATARNLVHSQFFIPHERFLQLKYDEKNNALDIIRESLSAVDRVQLKKALELLGETRELPTGENELFEFVIRQFTTSYSDRGRLIPAVVQAADLMQFMRKWAPYTQHGLIVLDLHTPRVNSLLFQDIPKDLNQPMTVELTPAVAYWGTHWIPRKNAPSQLIMPYEEYNLVMVLAGMTPISPKQYPPKKTLPTNVSLTLYRESSAANSLGKENDFPLTQKEALQMISKRTFKTKDLDRIQGVPVSKSNISYKHPYVTETQMKLLAKVSEQKYTDEELDVVIQGGFFKPLTPKEREEANKLEDARGFYLFDERDVLFRRVDVERLLNGMIREKYARRLMRTDRIRIVRLLNIKGNKEHWEVQTYGKIQLIPVAVVREWLEEKERLVHRAVAKKVLEGLGIRIGSFYSFLKKPKSHLKGVQLPEHNKERGDLLSVNLYGSPEYLDIRTLWWIVEHHTKKQVVSQPGSSGSGRDVSNASSLGNPDKSEKSERIQKAIKKTGYSVKKFTSKMRGEMSASTLASWASGYYEPTLEQVQWVELESERLMKKVRKQIVKRVLYLKNLLDLSPNKFLQLLKTELNWKRFPTVLQITEGDFDLTPSQLEEIELVAKKTIAEEFRYLRREILNEGQITFSDYLETHQVTLSRYERGVLPITVDLAKALRKARRIVYEKAPEKLKRTRLQLDVSQVKMGELLGFKVQHVRKKTENLESGHTLMPPGLLQKAQKLLGTLKKQTGLKLRFYRERAGLTQEELVEAIDVEGVDKARNISLFEKGTLVTPYEVMVRTKEIARETVTDENLKRGLELKFYRLQTGMTQPEFVEALNLDSINEGRQELGRMERGLYHVPQEVLDAARFIAQRRSDFSLFETSAASLGLEKSVIEVARFPGQRLFRVSELSGERIGEFFEQLGLADSTSVDKDVQLFNKDLTILLSNLGFADRRQQERRSLPLILNQEVLNMYQKESEKVVHKILGAVKRGDELLILKTERKASRLIDQLKTKAHGKVKIQVLPEALFNSQRVGVLTEKYQTKPILVESLSSGKRDQVSVDEIRLDLDAFTQRGIDPIQVLALIRRMADDPNKRAQLFFEAGFDFNQDRQYWVVGQRFVQIMTQIYSEYLQSRQIAQAA